MTIVIKVPPMPKAPLWKRFGFWTQASWWWLFIRPVERLIDKINGSSGINEMPQAGLAQETPCEQVPAGKERG